MAAAFAFVLAAALARCLRVAGLAIVRAGVALVFVRAFALARCLRTAAAVVAIVRAGVVLPVPPVVVRILLVRIVLHGHCAVHRRRWSCWMPCWRWRRRKWSRIWRHCASFAGAGDVWPRLRHRRHAGGADDVWRLLPESSWWRRCWWARLQGVTRRQCHTTLILLELLVVILNYTTYVLTNLLTHLLTYVLTYSMRPDRLSD